MSSAQPANDGSSSDAPLPPSIPIGVRTRATVPGYWVAAALIAALGLTALVFLLLPARLPPAREVARPDAPPASTPQAASRTGEASENVRQRPLMEEAGSRYQANREALIRQGAAARAPAELDAAKGLAEQAAAAAAAGDFPRARQLYEDANKRLAEIAGRAEQPDKAHAPVAAGEARESAGKREARAGGRGAAENFEGLMTSGLGQLERSEWPAAEQSFSAALKLRPADSSAADGLARAKDGRQRATLVQLQQEAQALESAERWEDALAAYQRATALDPAVDFARQGAARSARMIQLYSQADGFLASPERLYTQGVRDEAQQLLAALERDASAGPRIAQARQKLGAALKRATTRITVRLASDNATEVTLFRVGALGRFQEREVALTPGTYTVVGSRPGYRDVRIEMIVAPDTPAPQIFVACKERV